MFNAVNLQFDHLIINWITIHILVSVGWVHDWKVWKYVYVDFNLNARNDNNKNVLHNNHYDVLAICYKQSSFKIPTWGQLDA